MSGRVVYSRMLFMKTRPLSYIAVFVPLYGWRWLISSVVSCAKSSCGIQWGVVDSMSSVCIWYSRRVWPICSRSAYCCVYFRRCIIVGIIIVRRKALRAMVVSRFLFLLLSV